PLLFAPSPLPAHLPAPPPDPALTPLDSEPALPPCGHAPAADEQKGMGLEDAEDEPWRREGVAHAGACDGGGTRVYASLPRTLLQEFGRPRVHPLPA
ncbi:unnamed protein product, partial [Urochloa humidicola]